MKKKINPRRRPASMAEVNKAKKSATDHALEHAILLVLFPLVDKHGATPEELQQLSQEVNKTALMIQEGYLSWADIKHTLIDEYGVNICLE